MSNTSTNKTANKPTKSNKDKDKLRVIVGEIGRDTKTGILGRGYSNDNGKTFHVLDTMYGRLYGDDDINAIWENGTKDRVQQEVDSATAEIPSIASSANAAVKRADSAVANSKVNSDAIKAIQSAASEAKAGANEALANAQTAINNVASLGDKVNTNEANISATQKQIEAKADQVTVDNLNKTVSSQVGEIQANANGLLLKAGKTVTDILNKSVQEQQVQQKVLADQIKTKVTSSDVKEILADGKYATQDYTQTLVNQTSRTLSANITEVQDNADSNHQADVNQMVNLQASIDGVQNTVKNKADISQVTQLNNLVQSKVDTKDYESKIDQLSDDINARVAKGDLISQINMEAGQTLIQSDKIYLDAGTVAFSGKAFIPSAAIASLEADKITTGTLNGIHIHQIETAKGRSIDISNGNITLKSNDPYEPRITFDCNGQFSKMFNAYGDLECDSLSLFNFAPSDPQSLHPIPFFRVENTSGSGSGNASMHLDHAIIGGHEWWASADGITFGRSYDGVNTSSTYVDLYAKSFDPHSQLSSKTRIEKLDGKEALKTIMADDMYTYQFKSDVASGSTKRYASLIIDDVHDAKQYQAPDIFIADNGKCRDDGTQLAYLIATVQYQQHEIEELKSELKKGKVNE